MVGPITIIGTILLKLFFGWNESRRKNRLARIDAIGHQPNIFWSRSKNCYLWLSVGSRNLKLRNPTRLNFLVSLLLSGQHTVEPRTRRGRRGKDLGKKPPWGGGGAGRKRPPTDIMIISSSLSPGILYRKRCFCGSIFRFLSRVYNG